MGGDDIYIRSDEYAWIPARLVEQDETTAKVAIPQYENEEAIASDGGKGAIGFKSAVVKLKDYQGHVLPLQNVGAGGELTPVDDMVDLPYLHEVRVLFILYIYTSFCFRFCLEKGIFNYIILFSCNVQFALFLYLFLFLYFTLIYAYYSTYHRLPFCLT